MASQGSDKLKAMLALAQERARAAQATLAAVPTDAETNRVESLLDRNEALPDPRALSRLYLSKDLVERLPDDEDSASPPSPTPELSPQPAPAVAVAPAPAMPAEATPGTAEPAAEPQRKEAAPARPPMSPAQIREVMRELHEQFASNSYVTYEAKPLPVDVIPMPEEEVDPAELVEEPNELFYVLGAVVALVVIGVFVVLALNGPLRYRPPAAGPSASPSASARR
ncbi:MAG: hypothetical protein QOK05_2673 [Chloroflexota bacterium]|jgi:hypothetical protein|nr:hypothetical protein [Chloroflexota bacterium]